MLKRNVEGGRPGPPMQPILIGPAAFYSGPMV